MEPVPPDNSTAGGPPPGINPGGPPGRRFAPPPRPPFSYGGLIKESWRTTWRHKYLWFFGLFAFGSSTTLGNYSFNFNSNSFFPNRQTSSTETSGIDIGDWVNAHIGLILAVFAALVAVAVLVWLWSVVCRGAVVGAVNELREGQPSGFGAAFGHGRRGFWRLLLLDLLVLLIAVGIVIIFAAVVMLLVFLAVSGRAGRDIDTLLLVLLGAALFGLLVAGFGYFTLISLPLLLGPAASVIIIFATRALIIDRSRPVQSLSLGWRTITQNLTRTLLLFLIGTGLGMAAGIGTAIAVFITFLPALFAWIFTGAGGWHPAAIIASILLSLIPLAVLAFIIALMNTYFTTFWTIVYRRFKGRETGSGAALKPGQPDAGFPAGS